MNKWLKMIPAKKPVIEENINNVSTRKQNGTVDLCLVPIMKPWWTNKSACITLESIKNPMDLRPLL